MTERGDVETVTASGPLAALYPYFPISTTKFVTLSVVTFGLYEVYWFYQNFVRIRARTNEDLSPFWRAFWCPLWGFDLFGRVRTDARARGIEVAWTSGAIGLLFLAMNLVWGAPDPFSLFGILTFVPVIPVVQTIRRINDLAPATEDPNDTFSGVNVVGIIVGSLFLLLVGIGALMPE